MGGSVVVVLVLVSVVWQHSDSEWEDSGSGLLNRKSNTLPIFEFAI